MKRFFTRAALGAMLAFSSATAFAIDPPDVDLTRAKEIHMARCFMCHGENGESSTPLYPRLAGQHYQYTAKQLEAFLSGKRESRTMGSMVEGLTVEDMVALGVLYEAMPTGANVVEDQELLAVGRFIYHRGNEFSGVAPCASCHGVEAHGNAELPRLASQIARYTERQLKSFNDRPRTTENDVMHSIAANMTELEIKAVAAYVSALD